MRLVSHNLLVCHAKNCDSNNFPLQFKDVEVEIRESECNTQFMRNFVPKIEWKALVETAKELGDNSLPLEQPDVIDDELLKNLYHVLFDIHVESGSMTCPNCKHVYPIMNGIPNMLLAEHEIA